MLEEDITCIACLPQFYLVTVCKLWGRDVKTRKSCSFSSLSCRWTLIFLLYLCPPCTRLLTCKRAEIKCLYLCIWILTLFEQLLTSSHLLPVLAWEISHDLLQNDLFSITKVNSIFQVVKLVQLVLQWQLVISNSVIAHKCQEEKDTYTLNCFFLCVEVRLVPIVIG